MKFTEINITFKNEKHKFIANNNSLKVKNIDEEFMLKNEYNKNY
jgi:hypothetical protein